MKAVRYNKNNKTVKGKNKNLKKERYGPPNT